MTECLRVSTIDGKYTVISSEDEQGRHVTYLRHGEPWPQGAYHQNDVMLALALDVDQFRRLARNVCVRPHFRLAQGGEEVQDGGDCLACSGEWSAGESERHIGNCPLRRVS